MKAVWRAAAGFCDTKCPLSKTAGEIQCWWVESSVNGDFLQALHALTAGSDLTIAAWERAWPVTGSFMETAAFSSRQEVKRVCLEVLAEMQRTKQSSLLCCGVNPQPGCQTPAIAVLFLSQKASLLPGCSMQLEGVHPLDCCGGGQHWCQLCARSLFSWWDSVWVQVHLDGQAVISFTNSFLTKCTLCFYLNKHACCGGLELML